MSDSFKSYLPESVNLPGSYEQFEKLWDETYRRISYAVNSKDFKAHQLSVFDYPVSLDGINSFGSYLIIVSGVQDGMPALIALALKPASNEPAVIMELKAVQGTKAPWTNHSLRLTSSPVSLQLSHDLLGVTGAFTIRILG